MKVKLAICASGEGSNFESIVNATREGWLEAEVVGLITSRGKIGAIGRADRLGIPYRVISPRLHATGDLWDGAMVAQLREWKADWVVLAGFLARIGPRLLAAFPKHVVNSHPSLLPKYGGPGMYGENVHRAVLAAAEVETGITVHLIDEVYDRGPILAQARLSVLAADTVNSLTDRLKTLENSFYPRVLNDLVSGRLTTS